MENRKKYSLNEFRKDLASITATGLQFTINDNHLFPPNYRIERIRMDYTNVKVYSDDDVREAFISGARNIAEIVHKEQLPAHTVVGYDITFYRTGFLITFLFSGAVGICPLPSPGFKLGWLKKHFVPDFIE